METSSALLAICAGKSPVTGEFPAQRPVTRSFDVFFDLRLNKRLSKQSWGWWFETLSHPLWRHRNELLGPILRPVHVRDQRMKGLVFLNSLDPGKFEWNFRYVIFKQILVIDGWGISCEIALIWKSLDFPDDQSTLVQVMAWCRQATSHYLEPMLIQIFAAIWRH